MSKADRVYPVFLFNNKNTGGKGELLKRQIEFYSNMINDLEEHLESMNFFFTKFSEAENIPAIIKAIKKDLSAQELTRPLLNNVLTHMVEGREDELLKLDPLKKEERDNVLKLITENKTKK